jgi:hypothetical protein
MGNTEEKGADRQTERDGEGSAKVEISPRWKMNR